MGASVDANPLYFLFLLIVMVWYSKKIIIHYVLVYHFWVYLLYAHSNIPVIHIIGSYPRHQLLCQTLFMVIEIKAYLFRFAEFINTLLLHSINQSFRLHHILILHLQILLQLSRYRYSGILFGLLFFFRRF